jgi:hypothetical protein
MTVKDLFEKWWSVWHLREGMGPVPEELTVRHKLGPDDPGGTWMLKNLLYIAFVEGYKERK